MLAFLLTYFLVYGGLNLLCHRALAPLLPAGWPRVLLAGVLVLLVLAPMGIRRLEDWGLMPGARVLSFVAWHWMAIAFWLGVLVAPLLAWNALAGWRNTLGGSLPLLPHARAMAVIGTLVGLLLAWGVAEAQAIRVREVKLTAPAGSGLRAPLRFAFITDVHLSLIRGERLAQKIRRLIDAAQPEFVLSGGDFLDGQAVHLEDAAALLAPAAAPRGKFGVLGNHEWYSGLGEAERTHAAAGIRLLRGEQVAVRSDVLVAGSDDPTGIGHRRSGQYFGADAVPNFKAPPAERPYTIYLFHQPQVPPTAAGKFDLMLSGHTHGGQIFPFGLLVRLRYAYVRGLHALPEGGLLYVSPGTGTWGPSLRVLARPEVTLFTVEP